MTKIFRYLIFLIFLFPAVLCAQKKTFSLEDLFRDRSLMPKSITNLQWIANTHEYSYSETEALFRGRMGSGDDEVLVSLDKLNTAVTAAGGEELKRFPAAVWINPDSFYFLANNDLYIYTVKEGSIVKTAGGGEDAENMDIAPKTLRMAYTSGNNLFVASGGKQMQVSHEPDTGIITGQTVHRNEWGIKKGTFWSPSGNLLAFYRMDESMVTQYPLIDDDTRIAEVKNIRYPMAGMNSHHVSVGVFNPQNGQKIFLETGEPREQFLTNLAWTPDEKHILLAIVNRQQNHMKLCMYDAATGAFVKTLFEETDTRYVEPMTPPVFLNLSPDRFIWQSRRDGYNHLYLYDLNGQLIRQLTSGQWEVNRLLGVEPKDQAVWYIATAEEPVCKDLYQTEVRSGKTKRISSGQGVRNATLSHDFAYYIEQFNNMQTASQVSIFDKNGKQSKELLLDKDPLAGHHMPDFKVFTIQSKDNVDLYCRMLLPPDFDDTKKYPVLIYVYGGPHSQLITNSWLAGSGMFLTYLATQGYIVFTLDNRGTNNRGKEFEQIIHRRLGVVEVEDQMAGVAYLKSLPYVDASRIGVHGWSYGGFMTISMLARHPDVFKMGVCGGPVTDWKYYEVMYGERYMDTPEENPEGYEQTSLLNLAADITSDLLIIHGSMDDVVVMQHSMTFLKKCVEHGVLVDFFVYPGHGHGVTGKDRLHLFRKIEQYIKTRL